MTQAEKRNSVIFRIAAALLLGVLLTMRMFAGVPARYTSNAQGSDSTRVARCALTVTAPADKRLEMTSTPSGSVSTNYSFTVTNKNAKGVCEVAMTYKVVVTLPAPLVSGVTLKLNSKDADTISADGKVYVFNGQGTFAAGVEKTYNETLTVTVNSWFDDFSYVDINQVSATRPSTTAIYYLDGIQVDAVAEQID